MGREVKRVPMDFNWPMRKTWEGYVNQHYKKCPDCDNGATKSAAALAHLVHLLLIAGADSTQRPKGYSGHPTTVENWPGSPYRHQWPHLWLVEAGISDVGDTLHELTAKLCGRAPRGPFGHDSIDRWTATAAIIEAAKLPKRWGQCKTCKGSAIAPECCTAYNRWRRKNPPKGKGWQMWETTSEGSPISPVFATPEQLAQWLADTKASAFGREGATYEQWLAMIGVGSAPSMIMAGGVVQSGVEASETASRKR